MFDYRYLRAFILIGKHSSFSKTAMELRIAQSAISRQIKLLEQSLNQELIIRSSKKVILTDKGRELFLAAKNFEATIKNIFENEQTKTIHIGVLQGLLENWFQHILSLYYKDYSNNIVIKVASPMALKNLLHEGQLDIIFINENIQSELISALKLFDETLVLISKEKVSLEQIHQYRWIIYDDEDNLIRTYRKRSDRIIQVDDMSTIIQLVKAGIGLAVVPHHVVGDEPKLFVEKFTQSHKNEIYLATLNFRAMPQYLKDLIQFIVKQKHPKEGSKELSSP